MEQPSEDKSLNLEQWLDDVCESLPPDGLAGREVRLDQAVILVHSSRLLSVMRDLRDQWGFRYLCDVTALDMLPAEPRFQVVYHLWSHQDRRLIRVKTTVVGDSPVVPSVTPLWTTANWHERECYDLFGIEFKGHPDLQRILTPDGWQGHPLRKDYPVEGPPEVQQWVPERYGKNAAMKND